MHESSQEFEPRMHATQGVVIIGNVDTPLIAQMAAERVNDLAHRQKLPGSVQIVSDVLYPEPASDADGTQHRRWVYGDGTVADITDEDLGVVEPEDVVVGVRAIGRGGVSHADAYVALGAFNHLYKSHVEAIRGAESSTEQGIDVKPAWEIGQKTKIVAMSRYEYFEMVVAAQNPGVKGITVFEWPLRNADDCEQAAEAIIGGYKAQAADMYDILRGDRMFPNDSVLGRIAAGVVGEVWGSDGENVLVVMTADSESGEDGVASFDTFEAELVRMEDDFLEQEKWQRENPPMSGLEAALERNFGAAVLVTKLLARSRVHGHTSDRHED
jgi:hypothetical protein